VVREIREWLESGCCHKLEGKRETMSHKQRAEELKELRHLLGTIAGLNNGSRFIESVQWGTNRQAVVTIRMLKAGLIDDRAKELKELRHLLGTITGLNNGSRFIESVQWGTNCQAVVIIRMLKAGLVDCTHLLNCTTDIITNPAKDEFNQKIIPTTRWPDDRAEELKELRHLLGTIAGLNNGSRFIESVQWCIETAKRLQMRRDLHPSFIDHLEADCIQERQTAVDLLKKEKSDELLEQRTTGSNA